MGFFLMTLWHVMVGGMCAYQGRGRLEARDEVLGPPYLLAQAATTLVGGPVAAWFFHFYPSWFFHYLLDPTDSATFETYRFPLSALTLLFLVGATSLGFMAVRRAIVKMHPPYSAFPVAAAGLLFLLFTGIGYARVFFVGDAEQFLTASARPIFGHMAGVLSLLPLASGALVALVCGKYFKEDLSSRPPVAAR
ncbi:MAG: hypothetical protein AB2A00_29395 [Myxococcota bacterium]